jgi:hypothetical protein
VSLQWRRFLQHRVDLLGSTALTLLTLDVVDDLEGFRFRGRRLQFEGPTYLGIRVSRSEVREDPEELLRCVPARRAPDRIPQRLQKVPRRLSFCHRTTVKLLAKEQLVVRWAKLVGDGLLNLLVRLRPV